MKPTDIVVLLSGVATAHFAPKTLLVDGNRYPARDARVDEYLGAKRVEWSYKNVDNFTWMALGDVNDPSITCGIEPKAPALNAVARAGANITIAWTEIVQHHLGPSLTYLGAWKQDQPPQAVKFFKIHELGYDKVTRKWGNEIVIDQDYKNTFQLPSDIKAGTYILRTELLSLHGNGRNVGILGKPQFYTHCFNLDIRGDGTVEPAGVTFPGGYKKDEPGVTFALRGGPNSYQSYVVPGPPLYKGKYEAPTGPSPTVTPEETGVFPPEMEKRYSVLMEKYNILSAAASTFFNGGKSTVKNPSPLSADLNAVNKQIAEERLVLRADAIRYGLVRG